MADVLKVSGPNIETILVYLSDAIESRRDDSVPLHVYLTSPGGSVGHLFMLARLINKTPNILIIFVGSNSSAAAILYSYIEPSKRTSIVNFSRFMYHKPSLTGGVYIDRNNADGLNYIRDMNTNMADIITKYILDDTDYNTYLEGVDTHTTKVSDVYLKMVTTCIPPEIDSLPLCTLDGSGLNISNISAVNYDCELFIVDDLKDSTHMYISNIITAIQLNDKIKAVSVLPKTETLSSRFISMNMNKPTINGVQPEDKYIILYHNTSINPDIRCVSDVAPFDNQYYLTGSRMANCAAIEESRNVNNSVVELISDLLIGTPKEYICDMVTASLSNRVSLINIMPTLIPYKDYLYNKYKICLYYPEVIYDYMIHDENGICVNAPSDIAVMEIKDEINKAIAKRGLIQKTEGDISWT